MHVAPEFTRDGVGLGDPIEGCLASTSRGNRWRVGRALQMAENLADHFGLGEGGENPQRPLTAKRAAGHLQHKHPLEQPRPTPVRRRRAGLLFLYALLVWRGDNRGAQLTVRRQTATIADEMDARQWHQRRQLFERSGGVSKA